MTIQPTEEAVMALWRELPSETQDGREPDDVRPWVAAVLAAATRGQPLPGEPVWSAGERKRMTLEMESAREIEQVNLGEADRPSEVARLLRRAADDIEWVFHHVTAEPVACSELPSCHDGEHSASCEVALATTEEGA